MKTALISMAVVLALALGYCVLAQKPAKSGLGLRQAIVARQMMIKTN